MLKNTKFWKNFTNKCLICKVIGFISKAHITLIAKELNKIIKAQIELDQYMTLLINNIILF